MERLRVRCERPALRNQLRQQPLLPLPRRVDFGLRAKPLLNLLEVTSNRLRFAEIGERLRERHNDPRLTINRQSFPGVPGVDVVAAVATHNDPLCVTSEASVYRTPGT